MKIPKVEVCCCGCSLRNGSLALIIISLIFSCLSIFNAPNSQIFLTYALLIMIEISALCGIFKEKPDYLIGHLFYQVLSLIILIICMLLLLFGASAIEDAIAKIAETDRTHQFNVDSFNFGTILIIEVILGLFAGLQFYFFVVVFSLYRKMKEESAGLSTFQ